jgi:hypothetical protein
VNYRLKISKNVTKISGFVYAGELMKSDNYKFSNNTFSGLHIGYGTLGEKSKI